MEDINDRDYAHGKSVTIFLKKLGEYKIFMFKVTRCCLLMYLKTFKIY